MADPVLTWADVLLDNGTPADHPLKADGFRSRDNGVYAFGLPRTYSWDLGGESFLGDVARMPANGKIPNSSAMTAFHLVYPEAIARGGAAKPTVACNVIIRKYKAWIHKKSGGWVQVQAAPPDFVTTGRFTGPQTGNQATGLTVVRNADGSFTEQAPPPGWCNHGWINSRGAYTAGSVDGAFSIFEIRVDKPGANLIAASGIDWWNSPTAPFPDNTGYSMSCWRRLTTEFQIITGSSLSEAILRADPPPPLVGIGAVPVVVPPVTGIPGPKGDKGDPGPQGPPGVTFLLNGKPLAPGDVLTIKA